MMQYVKDSKDGGLRLVENSAEQAPFFTIMSAADFRESKESLPYYEELLGCLGSIRYRQKYSRIA